jgi:hypothetical protein
MAPRTGARDVRSIPVDGTLALPWTVNRTVTEPRSIAR